VSGFLPVLILVLLVAIAVREDAILILFYFLAGVAVVGQWWSHRALRAVTSSRRFPQRAFLDESVPIQLEIVNTGWLPLAWLRVQDDAPVDLVGPDTFRRAVSLGPRARAQFEYRVWAGKRGYYRLGPLRLSSGDVLGLTADTHRPEGQPEHLIVYPRIVPLARVKLPSHSPLGTLRHTQPIFEDPSRVLNKRDYVAGDSLRQVDWKATAAAGRLQVKQFEPSIALTGVLLLNLNRAEYEVRTRIDATELAIVIAASIADWLVEQKQSVGLITNGLDPLQPDGRARRLPARKGRAHLMQLLDVLARIQITDAPPLPQLLQQAGAHLTWGTTVVAITGRLDAPLLESLFQARRAGLNAVIFLAGLGAALGEVGRKAGHFGFPVYQIRTERDLEVWQP
jgi:uncharacterized protein (DUF58 family)